MLNQAAPATTEPCGSHPLWRHLGDRWTVLVIAALAQADAPLRHSDLRRRLPRISQRLLTQTLRSLERDSLIVRRVIEDIPPKVEYRLSDLGWGMVEAMKPYGAWMKASWPLIENARRAFALKHTAHAARPPTESVASTAAQ